MKLSSLKEEKFIVPIKETNDVNKIKQLLHEQLLKQNRDVREAHEKSLDEMEELKRFQGSTFDTMARRRYYPLNSQPRFSMIREIFMMLNQYAVENPTLPVNLCLSHIIQFLVECYAVL